MTQDEYNALVAETREHTPGPWRWEVNAYAKQVNLCGGLRPRFDLTVMGFRRWGMGSAAPTFIDDRLTMHRADEHLSVVKGREHHASWFQTIDHPDARLIAAAPALLAEVGRLREALAEIERAWDWWQIDPTDRCASVVVDAIYSALRGDAP